jgi:ribonuclease-3
VEWNPNPVETKIGINFKNSDILYLALSHRSYAQHINEPEANNERLEFLGTAILDMVVTDYLYHHCPYLEISNLKALRSKLMEGERLTQLWYQLGLGEAYPFLGLTEERHRLRQQSQNPFGAGLVALAGAIYLDRSFSQVQTWLTKHLIAPVLERHLKDIKERSSPDKQIKFLGDSLIKAIAASYLYCHLPCVSAERLKELHKELISKNRQVGYTSKLNSGDLTALNLGSIGDLGKSFEVLLAMVYLEHSTLEEKRAFKNTSTWFEERFLDGDEILRQAIALLLKDGKSQKWIVRHVMGYESKDYHAGRDHFNAVLEGEKAIPSGN